MSEQPIRSYFALESGEFLDQIETLIGRPGEPDLAALVRLARSVRGSARIAAARDTERGAAAFEKALRSLMDQGAWEERHRPLVVRTTDDLRVLVRAHAGGSEAGERADSILERWGEPSSPGQAERPIEGAGEGMLPFVRGELVTIAGLLDEVVDTHSVGGDAKNAVRRVLQRLRVVRGVRGGDRIVEVQNPLAQVEEFLTVLLGPDTEFGEDAAAAVALGAAVLREADGALAGDRSPRKVDSLDAFRERWLSVVGTTTDIVPITDFFPDDDAPVIVSSRTAPVPPPGDLLPDEVASFVRIETTGLLDQAEAAASGQGEGGGGASRIAALAGSVAEMAASYRLKSFADAARAVALRARGGSVPDLVEPIRALRMQLPGAGVAAISREEDVRTDAPASTDEAGIIPVETLLYDGHAALDAALTMRRRIDQLLDRETSAGSELRERLEELFDLIELGRNGQVAADD